MGVNYVDLPILFLKKLSGFLELIRKQIKQHVCLTFF